jgi:hypothetical protein
MVHAARIAGNPDKKIAKKAGVMTGNVAPVTPRRI